MVRELEQRTKSHRLQGMALHAQCHCVVRTCYAGYYITQGTEQHFLICNPAVGVSADSGTLTIQYNRDSTKVLKKLEDEIAALKAK